MEKKKKTNPISLTHKQSIAFQWNEKNGHLVKTESHQIKLLLKCIESMYIFVCSYYNWYDTAWPSYNNRIRLHSKKRDEKKNIKIAFVCHLTAVFKLFIFRIVYFGWWFLCVSELFQLRRMFASFCSVQKNKEEGAKMHPICCFFF